MSLSLKSPHPSIEWLGEPELAFAHGLTHIDPKVGIPASGPWSLNEANHPASVTAGFIGTAECMDKARTWLSRAAEGVDGDDDHHPFCGFQASGPFASQLRANGPAANITASEIREELPVTLRFANEVGTILRDLPDDYAPEARYAFYM